VGVRASEHGGQMMRRPLTIFIILLLAGGVFADTKDAGTTNLKDFQPAGTTNKEQKKQRYDLVFDSPSGKEYTCRTGEKTSVNATDFVVGQTLSFKIKNDKAKVKNAEGKELDCTIVRAEAIPGTR
jgi:hypothetical protein